MKKDLPVPAPEPGDLQTKVIEIGYPYLNQVYYRCIDNKVVSVNTKYDWDIAFENSMEGFHLKVNTAKGILVANQGTVDFSSVTTASGVTWQWDSSSGDLDSTAFGEWLNPMSLASKHEVFIIDLQSDVNGNNLGYRKLIMDSVNSISYTFTYANLDGTNQQTRTVFKDPTRNFTSFTFSEGGETVAIEPPKEDWDLCFTNYQHFFSNLPLPFVITGVLSNRYSNVKVADNTGDGFMSVNLSDTSAYSFTDRADEIGYDWKIRNSLDNSFTIDPNKYFILKDQNGFYFKIRFTDFYNDQGQKGYPTFEIQKL